MYVLLIFFALWCPPPVAPPVHTVCPPTRWCGPFVGPPPPQFARRVVLP